MSSPWNAHKKECRSQHSPHTIRWRDTLLLNCHMRTVKWIVFHNGAKFYALDIDIKRISTDNLSTINVVYTLSSKYWSRSHVLCRWQNARVWHANTITQNSHIILGGRYISWNLKGNVSSPQTQIRTERPDQELQNYKYHPNYIRHNGESDTELIIWPSIQGRSSHPVPERLH